MGLDQQSKLPLNLSAICSSSNAAAIQKQGLVRTSKQYDGVQFTGSRVTTATSHLSESLLRCGCKCTLSLRRH